jgi:hypothetical protein
VELRESVYGGVHAIVRIPNQMLASEDDEPSVPEVVGPRPPAEAAIPVETAAETTMELPVVSGGLLNGSAPFPDMEPALPQLAAEPSLPLAPSLPRQVRVARRRPGTPMAAVLADLPQHAEVERDGHAGEPVPVGRPTLPASDPGSGAVDRLPPLPQRQPQQHLVSQLRDPDQHGETGQPTDSTVTGTDDDAPDADRADPESAEKVRARLAAFQDGTARARQVEVDQVDDSRTS